MTRVPAGAGRSLRSVMEREVDSKIFRLFWCRLRSPKSSCLT